MQNLRIETYSSLTIWFYGSFGVAFEKLHGAGSVVAFESFTTGDKDFSAQMTSIVASGADVLFVPQYYSEVPLVIRAAKEMGWTKDILGSDSWGGGDLMGLCGDDCKGYYFSTHYAAAGAKGATKAFIDEERLRQPETSTYCYPFSKHCIDLQ